MNHYSITGAVTAAVPVRATWRMLCLGGLIAQGLFTVLRRFPALALPEREAEAQRWASRVLRVLEVDVALTGSLGPATRMLVANHVSWLDVMVVHSVVPQARFVAKAEVRHWPAIGALAAAAGSLFVERDRPRQARQVVAQISEAIVDGSLVAVFAEGTTTDGQAVLPFRAGLLQAAAETGCQVQPLALRYSEAGMPVSRSVPYIGEDSLLLSLWRLCGARGVAVTLKLLPARSAAQTDRRALALALHADVRSALDA